MKIAIIKLSALGDIIHSMVVLQFIKKQYPDIKIDWIVDNNFKQILEHNPDINKIIPLKIKQAKQQKSFKLLFGELKKLRKLSKYDYAIDMQGLLKSAVIAKLIKAKNKVGFDKNSIREKLASYFYSQKISIDYSENIIWRNCYLISKSLGINITKNDISNKQKFLFHNNHSFTELQNERKNIILVIGASFPSKIYPVKKYAEVVENVNTNFIAIYGNNKELRMVEQLQKMTSKIKIVKTENLDKLKSLLSQADLVIGGDTGPTHIAWGLGVKSIILFGSTPYFRNTWQDENNIVLYSNNKINIYKIDKNCNNISNIPTSKIINNI